MLTRWIAEKSMLKNCFGNFKFCNSLYGFDDLYLVERVSSCLQYSIPCVWCYKNIAVADLRCGDFRCSNLIRFQLLKNLNIHQFYYVDLNPTPLLKEDFEKFVILHHNLFQANLEIPNNSVDFVHLK